MRVRFGKVGVLGWGLLLGCLGCSGRGAANVAPEPSSAAAVVVSEPRPQVQVPAPTVSAVGSVEIVPSGAQSLTDVREVVLHFSVAGLPSATGAQVEISGPNGLPYETRVAALQGGEGVVQNLALVLPVAGTLITRNNLAGAWKVDLHVAGQLLSSQAFNLSP